MKALKIVGGIVLVIVVAVAIFYIGWLMPPSAEAVCGNVAAVMKKETGVELDPSQRQACLRRAEPPEFGRAPWVKRMKCLRDAKSSAEIATCSK